MLRNDFGKLFFFVRFSFDKCRILYVQIEIDPNN